MKNRPIYLFLNGVFAGTTWHHKTCKSAARDYLARIKPVGKVTAKFTRN